MVYEIVHLVHDLVETEEWIHQMAELHKLGRIVPLLGSISINLKHN